MTEPLASRAGPRRFRYRIDLTAYQAGLAEPPPGFTVRSPTAADCEMLAGLMLDAYRGTIDYEGEGMEEAIEAIEDFLGSETMLSASRLAVFNTGTADGGAASAVLAATYGGAPFISYVITASAHKRTGLARALVVDSLNRLQTDGLPAVYLAITEGNIASEGLFRSLGAYIDPDQPISDGNSSGS